MRLWGLTACMFSMCWKETKSGIATTTYSVSRSPEGQETKRRGGTTTEKVTAEQPPLQLEPMLSTRPVAIGEMKMPATAWT